MYVYVHVSIWACTCKCIYYMMQLHNTKSSYMYFKWAVFLIVQSSYSALTSLPCAYTHVMYIVQCTNVHVHVCQVIIHGEGHFVIIFLALALVQKITSSSNAWELKSINTSAICCLLQVHIQCMYHPTHQNCGVTNCMVGCDEEAVLNTCVS